MTTEGHPEIARLRELLIRADSFLSLLWHRYVPREHKETDLTMDVERTIVDLRNAYERADGLLAVLITEGPQSEVQGTQELKNEARGRTQADSRSRELPRHVTR